MGTFFMVIFAGFITVAGTFALARNQKRALRSRRLLKVSMLAMTELSKNRSFTFEEGRYTFVVTKNKRQLHISVHGNFTAAFERFEFTSRVFPESLERALFDPKVRLAFDRLNRDIQTLCCTFTKVEATFYYRGANAGVLASILQSLSGFCDALSHNELEGEKERSQLSAPSGAPVGVPPD